MTDTTPDTSQKKKFKLDDTDKKVATGLLIFLGIILGLASITCMVILFMDIAGFIGGPTLS